MTRSSLSCAVRWARIHLRRHIPFAMYTLASLSYSGWVVWNLTHLHH